MKAWLASLAGPIELPPGVAMLGLSYLQGFLTDALYYATAALVVWALLHRLLRRRLAHRLIAGWPARADVRREVAYSFLSLLVFASLSMAMTAAWINGHIHVYRRPDELGWAWLALSLPLLVVGQDLYFYATHRLLHTRWMLRHVHGVHHRSRNPSPWAAYAFHPVEALINGLYTPLALLTLPLHGGVLAVFVLHQIIRNTLGHAAVEAMPAGFDRHWLGRWFTTTTHHHLHHETASGNYGLWFTWWDRCFGTERHDYARRFAAATRPPAAAPAHPAARETARAAGQSTHALADH